MSGWWAKDDTGDPKQGGNEGLKDTVLIAVATTSDSWKK